MGTFTRSPGGEVHRIADTASGECLGGRYLWASDLILVDDTSRPSVEAVVRDLLATGDLPSAFSPADSTDPDAPSAANGQG